MIRYFQTEDINPTRVIKPIEMIAVIPLLEDEDYSVAWKAGRKVFYLGKNEEKNLHIIKSRVNHHKYYFTDEEMKKWFKDIPDEA